LVADMDSVAEEVVRTVVETKGEAARRPAAAMAVASMAGAKVGSAVVVVQRVGCSARNLCK